MAQGLKPFTFLLVLRCLPFQFAALRIESGQLRLHSQQLVFAKGLDVVLQGFQVGGRLLKRGLPFFDGAGVAGVLITQLLMPLLKAVAFGLGCVVRQHQFLSATQLELFP